MLDAADELLPGWGLHHPDMGPLLTRADVVLASRSGSTAARNKLLLDLARLGNVADNNCREAAAVLCHLLIPGVVTKLKTSCADDLYQQAAGHLWVACRTYPWESGGAVAPTITWAVRRVALADTGGTDVARYDRTWARTRLLAWDTWAMLEDGPVEPSSWHELEDLLSGMQAARVITSDEVDLIMTLMSVAETFGPKRATGSGLMSAEVSEKVGAELGIAGSSVRRRLSRTIDALQQASRGSAKKSGAA